MDTQDIRHALAAEEVHAWARHARAANGFGDGVDVTVTPAQGEKIGAALTPIMAAVARRGPSRS